MKLIFARYDLSFKVPGGTSRGVLHSKETYFIKIENEASTGIGEVGLFRGLSHDDRPDFEARLAWLSDHIENGREWCMERLQDYPSILFGLEQAFLSLEAPSKFELYPSEFTRGADSIPINGLVWMGDEEFMQSQIRNKLNDGFRVIKLKIGAIEFDTEMELLRSIRKDFSAEEIEIRVDANGAFSPGEAMEKLRRLSEFEIHSIEQPIRQGQPDEMAKLCEKSPVPIALDEELIGLVDAEKREELLKRVKPQYLIFKPSLIGGIRICNNWIDLCHKYDVGWWITSALESNIGLNAIAQYTYTLDNPMPQGLGTGGLFTNNIPSPLKVDKGALYYDTDLKWGDANRLFAE
jgi:o-succinylbenzoate synthase